MNPYTRRQFLRSAVAYGALGTTFLSYLGRQAQAGPGVIGDKKFLFIFQRGGNDGVNTVIPHGDTAYNPINRPSLYIAPNEAIDLNGFASLHPRMAPMMPLYDAGDLAVVHRVGYRSQSRSHFDSQDFWERGAPYNPDVKDGIFYRQLNQMLDLTDPTNSFAAATVDGSAFTALRGENPFPNFTSSGQFNFLGNTNQRTKFLGSLPSEEGAGDGEGMLGLYGDSPLAKALYAQTVNATGRALGGTLETLAAAQGEYLPENGAVYPTGSYGNRLRECAMLFKRTDVRILGVDIGGWDTHSNQGGIDGSHGNLLEDVAEGFLALSQDLQSQWNNLVVCTMTEFGRTSKENGSFGTDHAEGAVMFLAGGNVNGGVYNCDPSTWADQDMFSKSSRYVARKTDFRQIFSEIFMGHYGADEASLEVSMPGFAQAKLDRPEDFAPLGIM